ncbi:MAG: hypothetical protein JST80_07475, partial [Bdellovibrionales bacterium]|nr:hypothetical protein [Bdellovibrionales bacterium]
SGSRGGSSSGGYGNGGSRGGVASPVVNNSRTDVSSSTRRGRETITYSDRSSGRTVMQESYSRDRSTMTRNFYDRNQRISQSCNYERRRYHNTVYVYVYQPYHVWYEDYYWYHPFCSSGYYHNYWSYSWGWYNDPWYHYYGYYYRPYARYVYPSEWLVDYYWASLLADEYQDRVDQGTINTQQSTIQTQQSTIDAQQAEIDALKAQLKKQVDDEMVARKSGDTVALDTKLLDANHVYVVSTNMTLVTADAQAITCNLSSGDVISLAKEGIASNAQTATMLVRSAKSGNCTAGVKVLVSIEQLQEFENEFNRRLDAGAEKMKADPTVSQVLDPNPQEEVE